MVKHLRDEGARVTQIACGSRHTVVLTDLGKVSFFGHERISRENEDALKDFLPVFCCIHKGFGGCLFARASASTECANLG